MGMKRRTGTRCLCALGALVMMVVFSAPKVLAGPQDYWAVNSFGQTLARIDKTTGVGTIVGTTMNYRPLQTAFTPDGTLWTIFQDPVHFNWHLGNINKSTAQISQVGNYLEAVKVLASDSTGTLYGQGATGFYTIDQTTGFESFIGHTTGVLGGFVDLAFDNTDTLWGATGTDLYTIDIGTGIPTLVKPVTGLFDDRATVSGIAFDSLGTLYLTESSAINGFYTVNTSTGVATIVGSPGLGTLRSGDFEFGPQGVPLPTTVLMGLVGFGVVLVVRRRYFR